MRISVDDGPYKPSHQYFQTPKIGNPLDHKPAYPKKYASTSLPRKSDSKKTLVETVDLDDGLAYELEDHQEDTRYKLVPKDLPGARRILKNKKDSRMNLRSRNRESCQSIANMLSDNASFRSHQSLERVIEDLEHHNEDIMQEAKSTVKNFEDYIEELLNLNAEMETRINEYEEAYNLLEEERNLLEEELAKVA